MVETIGLKHITSWVLFLLRDILLSSVIHLFGT